MSPVPLRDNIDYRPQKRKKQAKSKRKQIDTAAADFETIDGSAWLYTMAWFEGQRNAKGHINPHKPKKLKSALDEYTESSPFTFKRFVDFIFDNAGIIWRRGGKNAVKGLRCPYLYFYNLKYDAGVVIKELQATSIDRIMNMEKIVIDAITTEPVSINRDKYGNPKLTAKQKKKYLLELNYLPKRHLRLKPLGKLALCIDAKGIERVRGAIDCFDIAQFYGKSLAKASVDAMKNGLIEQTKLDSIDTKRINEKSYRENNYEEIKKYALVDAEVTAQLSWIKVQELESNGFRMTNPYSPASVAERALLDLCELPSLDDMMSSHEDRVLSFWTAYQGGWFESLGSGLIQDVRAYDLASAYPYVMYHLPNCFEGHWSQGGRDRSERFFKWLRKRKPMTLGCAECTVTFPKNLPIYPASKMSSFGCVVNPQIVQGWFVADEIAEFIEWGADVRIRKWYIHYPDYTSQNLYPFRPFIEPAYKAKYELGLLKDSGEDFDRAAYDCEKIKLNSTYGKLVQAISENPEISEPNINDLLSENLDAIDSLLYRNHLKELDSPERKQKTGNIWNPIWGATITGATRARLAEFIRFNGPESIVGVATDGIILKTPSVAVPPLPAPAIYNLGEWEDDGVGDCLMIMSGVYSIRPPEGKIKSTYRGNAALFLGGDDQPTNWFDFCKENPTEKQIVRDHENHPNSRPYSIKEAKVKGDYSLINVFRVVRASIKALGDSNKRVWDGDLPETFDDLQTDWFESSPHRSLL